MKQKLTKYGLILTAMLSSPLTPAQEVNDSMLQSTIISITDQVILPVFTQALNTANDFDDSVRAFCNQPSIDTLASMQNHWKAAMQAWSASTVFRFGPMIEDNIDLKISYQPIRKIQIRENIQSLPNDMASVSVSARGLASVEYLVFDRDSTREELLARFLEQPARCAYLALMAHQLVTDFQTLTGAWMDTDSFYSQFTGQAARPSITRPEALGELVGSINHFLASSLRNKLGRPAGLPDTVSSPYKAESWRSGNSIENLKAGLSTLGKTISVDRGLADLLAASGHQQLARELQDYLELVLLKLDNIQQDLFTAVNDSPGMVEDAYQALKALEKLFEHQINEALDVQIGFSDQDGD